MGIVQNLVLVFVAGLLTAFATGLGAVPFFFVDEFSDRWNVGLWGLASGIMLSASAFGLIREGLASGTVLELAGGLLIGVALVVASGEILDRVDFGPDEGAAGAAADDVGEQYTVEDDAPVEGDEHAEEARAFVEGDFKQLVLILGVLTVHSFPEGVAIGVSFAELGNVQGIPIFGVAVPLLAVFMTVAISIQNVPEGLAIAIPLRSFDVSDWGMVGWAVFSSLPQPIGAVIAFGFVRLARSFIPYGFGFAAGAMIYLVATELVPEGLEYGEGLSTRGYPAMAGGLILGFAVMIPLTFL
ncbi:MAG: ZIP family metal transporter [Haloarculaceae archaeon]